MNRFKIACAYGADAVYLSGKKYGMRSACDNFTLNELKDATIFAHGLGKKVYVTLNIFPFDGDLDGIDEYIDYLAALAVDGVIVTDLGLIKRIQKRCNLPIHISTQANVTNSDTAKFYADMGAKRIVLARELTLYDIKNIARAVGNDVELECFVHGAMCVSYSGRCLLSAYLTGRSANKGECNQACRMRFTPEGLNETIDINQGDSDTLIFGGSDLNMIEHLNELIDCGVSSLKIEGRAKTEYYVGVVVGAYRRALNAIKIGKSVSQDDIDELYKAPNRGFNTGFYYGAPTTQNCKTISEFCGIVTSSDGEGCYVEMRNRFKSGDELEVLSFDKNHNKKIIVPKMKDGFGNYTDDAKHPMESYYLDGLKLPKLSMLRRIKK